MCSVVECMSMGILCLDHELCVIRYQLEGNQLHRLEMLSRASYQKKNQKRKKKYKNTNQILWNKSAACISNH